MKAVLRPPYTLPRTTITTWSVQKIECVYDYYRMFDYFPYIFREFLSFDKCFDLSQKMKPRWFWICSHSQHRHEIWCWRKKTENYVFQILRKFQRNALEKKIRRYYRKGCGRERERELHIPYLRKTRQPRVVCNRNIQHTVLLRHTSMDCVKRLTLRTDYPPLPRLSRNSPPCRETNCRKTAHHNAVMKEEIHHPETDTTHGQHLLYDILFEKYESVPHKTWHLRMK